LPGHKDDSTAWPQPGFDVAERGNWIGEEHHAKLGNHEIEITMLEGVGLSVHILETDVVEACAPRGLASPFEHLVGEVDS
jgi:hypothetical protein